MNEKELSENLDFCSEKLRLLEEPELPPSLSAKELFARLDRGELSLPDETQEQEPPARSAPVWRLVKRGLPLAACLVLAVFLYRSGAGGASGAPAPMMAADAGPQMAAASSSAATAESAQQEESAENHSAYFRSAGGEENGELQDSAAPEDQLMTQDQAGDDPATGGGADTGPVLKTEADLPQSIREQMLALAAQEAPEERLTPVVLWSREAGADTLESMVAYRDEAGTDTEEFLFTFSVQEEEGEEVVKLLSVTEAGEEPGGTDQSTQP